MQGLLKTETLHAYSVKDQSRRTLAHRKRLGFRPVPGQCPGQCPPAGRAAAAADLLHHPLQRLPPPTPGRGSRNGKVLPRKSKALPRRCQPLGCEQMVGRRRQRSYPAAQARSDVLSSARTSLHNCSLDEEKPFDSNDESIFCLLKVPLNPCPHAGFASLDHFPSSICAPHRAHHLLHAPRDAPAHSSQGVLCRQYVHPSFSPTMAMSPSTHFFLLKSNSSNSVSVSR